ncbi:MAG: hypothetical protein HY074_06950 [Deltaproteobacteria bacterium]|nr:hypothetical protein [Deltaproteobacteria bacterium]
MSESSKESLIRHWANSAPHAWLKENPLWVELFAELLARMPGKALQKLLGSARPLIVLPPVYFGRVVRLTAALPAGANILQLDARLLDRPRDEAVGILAHELAHLCVVTAPHADELKNDLEADQVACRWGFRTQLAQALGRDLESDHPRILAVQNAA